MTAAATATQDEQSTQDATPETGGSERMCALTREALPVEDLLRFVAAPDGTVMPDIRRKLPGRGINLRLSAAVVTEAARRKLFARGLKASVTVPDTLAQDAARLLRRDAIQSLSLANKAGLVTTGFSKVESLLAAGRAKAAIEASDGAEDGRRKIGQAIRRGLGERADRLPVIDRFSSAELELALGHSHVIHAAVLPGPAAEVFLARWRRLVRYEDEPLPPPTTKTRIDDVARTAGSSAE